MTTFDRLLVNLPNLIVNLAGIYLSLFKIHKVKPAYWCFGFNAAALQITIFGILMNSYPVAIDS